MALNIDASQMAQMTGLAKSSQLTKTERTDAVKKDNAAVSTVNPQQNSNVDRVEFSNEAKSYLDEQNTEENSEQIELAAMVSAQTEDSEDMSSDKISSLDLYSYTESELIDLVANGDITRSEYNNEMSRRSTGTEA